MFDLPPIAVVDRFVVGVPAVDHTRDAEGQLAGAG